MAGVARVRVYNVGFGDCFLLDLPTRGGDRASVLIDCGSLSFGDLGQTNENLVSRIISDVTVDGRARIDLVIASHRHKDHISGFGRPDWDDVQVGEVWLPWTEDPSDEEARELFEAQQRLALQITSSEARLRASPVRDEAADLILAMALNALSNEDAMRTLKTGFEGDPKRRYLERSSRPRRPRVLNGIRVHVLGPSRNPDSIRKMDPPSGQSYLAMFGIDGSDSQADDRDRPFPDLSKMTYQDFSTYGLGPGEPAREHHAGHAKGQLRKLVEVESLMSATALDYALNNTSLMLMFEVGDQYLLFPGDSQWGSWETALSSSWSHDLLRRTTFYKVGHHGSHNATPRCFVEEVLGDNRWAVCSVTPYSRWKKVPKKELMEALASKAPNRLLMTHRLPDQLPPDVEILDNGLVVDITLPVRRIP